MTPVARLEAALAATVDSSAPPPLAGGDIADVIGSVLHAFAHWLQSQLPASATPLYGIMREGRLLARLHRRHGGTAAEIWLNRRLCMKAAILSAEDDEALRNFLVRGRRLPLSPAQAACELGLPPPLSSPGLALTAGSDSLESFFWPGCVTPPRRHRWRGPCGNCAGGWWPISIAWAHYPPPTYS